MNSLKPAILVIILLLFSLIHAEELSLKDLTKMLQEKNLEIKISNLKEKIAGQEFKISNTLENPEFEYARGKGEPFDQIDNKKDIWELGISVKIPNPIYRSFLFKVHREEYSQALIREKIFKRAVIRELKVCYYNFQLYLKIYSLLVKKETITDKLVEIIKYKKNLGEVREIEYTRATLEKIRINADLYKLRKMIEAQKIQLNLLLNNTLPKDFVIKSNFTFTPASLKEGDIQNYLKDTLLVRMSMKKKKSKALGLKAEKSSIFEHITLFANKGNEPDAKIFKLGIGFEIPIFGTRTARIRKARYLKEKAEKEFEYQKNRLYAALHKKIINLKFEELKISNLKNSVILEREQTLELNSELYKQGEITLLEFLDTQRSLFETRSDYFKTITEWLILKSELEEILGEEL
jgi:cobalt-zinc-cadmium efflux system outer membrane protein